MLIRSRTVGLVAAGLASLTACTAPSSSPNPNALGAASNSPAAASTTTEPAVPASTAVINAGSSTFGGATTCGPEISGDLAKIPALRSARRWTHTWSDGRYVCTYHLTAGPLKLSVQKSADVASARHYFNNIRAHPAQTFPILGLQNFGLPAYRSPNATVVYRKGAKTLIIDASRVTATSATGLSPAQLAYQVATLVIACGHGPGLHHEC